MRQLWKAEGWRLLFAGEYCPPYALYLLASKLANEVTRQARKACISRYFIKQQQS